MLLKIPVQPGIILSDLSDHLPTFVMIKSTCRKQKHSSTTLRHNYKNLYRSTFLQEIKDALDMLPVNNGLNSVQPSIHCCHSVQPAIHCCPARARYAADMRTSWQKRFSLHLLCFSRSGLFASSAHSAEG